MTLLEMLVVIHLVGDYLLQTEFEAMNKATGKFWNRAILSHCSKYTLCFAPVIWSFGLGWLWLVLIFGTHMFFDRRWPVVAWRKYITRNSDSSIKNTFWLTVALDQIFHLIVLAAIAAASKI